jgi:adenine-specific DNA-methyltransferase
LNYIGSKLKLSSFLTTTIQNKVGDISQKIFCDIFAGTGMVGRTFKPLVKTVIANDLEYYAYVLNRNYIGNYSTLEYTHLIEELNNLDPVSGFVTNHYSDQGLGNRKYFKKENGQKIDAIRLKIKEWKDTEFIDENMYFFLLASLIESADKVANTTSVYGAFLKQIKKSADKDLILDPANFHNFGEDHIAYNSNANDLISNISGDILYMDPPYNERQYGANYHLLNTIALYDDFEPKGITGLRPYNKSTFCQKGNVHESFEDLIKKADFEWIFLSYNNESLMSSAEVREIMSRYGEYSLEQKVYQRYKADKNREHSAESTIEYLHILKKEK